MSYQDLLGLPLTPPHPTHLRAWRWSETPTPGEQRAATLHRDSATHRRGAVLLEVRERYEALSPEGRHTVDALLGDWEGTALELLDAAEVLTREDET